MAAVDGDRRTAPVPAPHRLTVCRPEEVAERRSMVNEANEQF